MPGPVSSVSPNASYDPTQLADEAGGNACMSAPAKTAPPPAAAAPAGVPWLPADFPGSTPLHKFRATGEVSWACMNDCVSSQGITGSAADHAAHLLGPAAAAALTAAIVTPIACYFACKDLESLAPTPSQPEQKEVPDASVYVP